MKYCKNCVYAKTAVGRFGESQIFCAYQGDSYSEFLLSGRQPELRKVKPKGSCRNYAELNILENICHRDVTFRSPKK